MAHTRYFCLTKEHNEVLRHILKNKMNKLENRSQKYHPAPGLLSKWNIWDSSSESPVYSCWLPRNTKIRGGGIYVHKQFKTSLYFWSKESGKADEATISAKNFFPFVWKGFLTLFDFPLPCG